MTYWNCFWKSSSHNKIRYITLAPIILINTLIAKLSKYVWLCFSLRAFPFWGCGGSYSSRGFFQPHPFATTWQIGGSQKNISSNNTSQCFPKSHSSSVISKHIQCSDDFSRAILQNRFKKQKTQDVNRTPGRLLPPFFFSFPCKFVSPSQQRGSDRSGTRRFPPSSSLMISGKRRTKIATRTGPTPHHINNNNHNRHYNLRVLLQKVIPWTHPNN